MRVGCPATHSSVPLSPTVSLSPAPAISLSPLALACVSDTPSISSVVTPVMSETPSQSSKVQAVGGVYPIRGDGLCGYHCAAALGALMQDPHALDAGFECSHDVVQATRTRWWAAKRESCASDAEMEDREVSAHVRRKRHLTRTQETQKRD